MKQFEYKRDASGNPYLETDLPGLMLTRLPLLNKSTAFTAEERDVFNLWGILPAHVSSLEEQVQRAYNNYRHFEKDFDKYIYLRLLQDRCEVLFYALLAEHLEEMMPIIYTPTVALAATHFSRIYRFPRGLVVSTKNIDRIDNLLANTPYPHIRLIVATDAEGILGIGDQGFGGMAICIGKLSLYTAAAGVDPALCLPVQLDVGTNHEELLEDPMYLGARHPRLTGSAYYNFINTFVKALERHHPGVLLQWEDFSRDKAFEVLAQHKETLPSFNDDIQGTGAVVLAGLLAATKRHGHTLKNETFLIFGAGAAGVGVARQLFAALKHEGLSAADAKAKIFMMDPFGLILNDRRGLESYKASLAQDPSRLEGWHIEGDDPSLLEVVQNARITTLLGFSGQAGAFGEEVTKAVCANTEHPIIFPLSNPTSHCEAKPEDLIRWTNGRVTLATGSPFDDVEYGGQTYGVGQGNNAFIFPGLGLGLMLSGAKHVDADILNVAARALSEQVSAARLERGLVYPGIGELRGASERVAAEVVRTVAEADDTEFRLEEDPHTFISKRMWNPTYLPIRKPQQP